MSSLRPKTTALYVERPRLLNQLPDDLGYVVHLEAPYGYGKSILSAHYADALENEGWRIVWAVASLDCRSSVALALDLSVDTPWARLLEQLWQVETLLVLEDVQGNEDLSPLLAHPQGIVLLASRTKLESPELVKLETQNCLIHLNAQTLAFDLEESQRLVIDTEQALRLWKLTGGWSLPLHFAALTGKAPDTASLLIGIKASLDEKAWEEILFLAALETLPESVQKQATESLVSKGFVQSLESAFRLHPYVAEMLWEQDAPDIKQSVAAQANRLPLLLQGKAYARCELSDELKVVLEATDAELWREDPSQLITWDKLIQAEQTVRRHWAIGAAHARLGDIESAIERFELALARPNLSAKDLIGILRDYCMPIGFHNKERGLELIKLGKQVIDQVDDELAGRFLANTALIHVYSNDFDAAITAANEALEVYPKKSDYRLGASINKALFEWDAYGSFEERLQTQLETLPQVEKLYAVQAAGQVRDIAIFHLWLNDTKQAVQYLKKAQDIEHINPAIGLEARATLAYLNLDSSKLALCCQEAKFFPNPYILDVLSMYKIRLELIEKQFDRAKLSYEHSGQGAFSRSAYALVLAELKKPSEALAILDEQFSDYSGSRAMQLYIMASRYIVTKEQLDLDKFLAITTAGKRILPGFIPLEALPNQVELSQHYRIEDVLRSNWKEALQYRLTDIPKLQLQLLAKLQASLFDEILELTDRQKQILTLLCIDRSRDEVAESMWPNVDSKKQRNNLNVQLNLLRKVIEPWGISTYLFEEGLRHFDSDYAELMNALENSDPAQVYELYKEPIAPGIHLDDIIELREQLREDVVQLLFDAGLETNESSYLNRVLELEPLHEEALQAVLKQLQVKGRKREAKQRYKKFAQLLKKELALEPLDETKALVDF